MGENMNIIECEYANNPRDIQANLEYFRDFLQKRGSAENTIDSYLTSVRHYHSLHSDVTVENLQAYKGWLMEHYKPNTVNTRIYGINQYVIALQEIINRENACGATETYKLPSVKHQQKPFLNNVISKRDYEKLKRCLKRDNNMFWYCLPGASAASLRCWPGITGSVLIPYIPIPSGTVLLRISWRNSMTFLCWQI